MVERRGEWWRRRERILTAAVETHVLTSPRLNDLPYAMAFGVADKWAKAFEDIYREPPQWYSGGTGQFSAINFASSIGNMSSAAASSMSSSPSSSGSGGGGSSGGGSGGGGGSGF